ncbi:hypothetical protein D9M70_618230 [compost metagenome]
MHCPVAAATRNSAHSRLKDQLGAGQQFGFQRSEVHRVHANCECVAPALIVHDYPEGTIVAVEVDLNFIFLGASNQVVDVQAILEGARD